IEPGLLWHRAICPPQTDRDVASVISRDVTPSPRATQMLLTAPETQAPREAVFVTTFTIRRTTTGAACRLQSEIRHFVLHQSNQRERGELRGFRVALQRVIVDP